MVQKFPLVQPLGIAGYLLAIGDDIVSSHQRGIHTELIKHIDNRVHKNRKVYGPPRLHAGYKREIQISQVVVDCSSPGNSSYHLDTPFLYKPLVDFLQRILISAYDNGRFVLPKQEIVFPRVHVHQAVFLQGNIEIGICTVIDYVSHSIPAPVSIFFIRLPPIPLFRSVS